MGKVVLLSLGLCLRNITRNIIRKWDLLFMKKISDYESPVIFIDG